MTLSSQGEGFQEVLSFVADPAGAAIAALILLSACMVSSSGVSYRMRRVRFPLAWTLGAGGAAAALGLFFALRDSHGWREARHIVWPATAGLLLLLQGGAPIIHGLSGYRPAEIRLTLRHWQGRRAELLRHLQAHFESLGLQIENPLAWRADLVARGLIRGTVEATKRIPYMVFVRAQDQPGALEVTLTAENMDIVIRDTGESANCETLLSAALAPFDEPPLKDTVEVNVTAAV
ncbi:MAG: hypothetical protein HUU25_04550 [Candidatus Sumerlaeia bacterium]|nr:hypothetical protein [Candidatus Sumerlaeia bacterium]